jgi:hypothetical protein
MNFKRLLGIVTAVCAVAVLAGSIGAGAASTPAKHAKDLSTNAGVREYLRSVGISSRGVVIQRGARNYAGPRCPGKRWTCTRAHRVVQVARAGGKNTFACSTARCAVVQVAAASARMNKAICVKTTGLGASCSITQSSSGTTGNTAMVWEDAGKLTGLTQTALYSASIKQKATGSGANIACVHQAINIDGSTKSNTSSATVALEAHQSIGIRQDSASGGNTVEDASAPVNGVPGCVDLPASCSPNLSDPCGLSQTQTLSSTATSRGTIIQNENKANSLCPDGTATHYANMCLDIKQNQSAGFKGIASGANKAIFTQTNTLTAIATSPVAPTQWQSSQNGGILAAVNQDSSDVSTAIARQKETQCEDAEPTAPTTCHTNDPDNPYGPALSQTQYGPVHKGPDDSSQTGNTGDTFTVTQQTQQDNDTFSGQTDDVLGAFHTDGSGTVTQTATVDGETTTGAQAGQDPNSSIQCGESGCTATPPPTPTIDSAPPNPSDSSDATFTFSDSDPTVTFSCQLDGGGFSDCSSGSKSYSGLSDGEHTFEVTATNPTSGLVSDAASYTWTIATGNASVLIAGPGDFSSGTPLEPNNNLAQVLTGAGYSVTQSAALPADLTSFGQVWWVGATPPTAGEQTQLINFAQSGKGVYLTGENSGCCGALNTADQSMVNAMVAGGGITVGGACGCSPPFPVNSSVVGGVATDPFTVTSWQPSAPGAMGNVPASSVFSYSQPNPSEVVAAVWDRASVVGNGRLVVFMDVNWPEVAYRAANWSDVAQNVAFFLSGLSNPPSPIVSPAGMVPMASTLFGAQAHATPARSTSRTASSGASSTR